MLYNKLKEFRKLVNNTATLLIEQKPHLLYISVLMQSSIARVYNRNQEYRTGVLPRD